MALKIITDSTSDISPELARELDIEIVPLKVFFGDKMYIDKITISNEEFFEKLTTSKELPTTTTANVGEFLNLFNKFLDDDILCVFISPKLSGTFNAATQAKQETGRDNIYIVDSNSVSIGLSLLVFEAVKLREKGLPALEICETLNALSGNIRLFVVIDTLKYLVKGGRLGTIKGIIGEALGIKPILCVSFGDVKNIDKARGIKQAAAQVLEIVKKTCKIDALKDILFGHAGNLPEVENLIALFKKEFKIKPAGKCLIGSVVGTHAGPGAIGVAFFIK